MRQVSNSDRAILELTNIKPRSKKYLQNKLYELIGLTEEQTEQNVQELLNANWITESGGLYNSNPDSQMYIYPEPIDKLMDNKAAIHKVIKLANQAYYPNLTFDEFVTKYKPGVERRVLKEILVLACNLNYLNGLPSDLRTNESTNQNKVVKNVPTNALNTNLWHEKTMFGLDMKYWLPIIIMILIAIVTISFM